jgi:hypothetical protein
MINTIDAVDEERPARGNYDNRMAGKGERYKITLGGYQPPPYEINYLLSWKPACGR